MKSKINCNILRVLIISIITLSNLVTIVAQEPAKAPKKTKIEEEIEKKSISMLYTLIEDAQNLQLPQNRAKVLMAIADMLWNHDEKKARELMDESIKLFQAMPTQDDEDDDSVDGESSYYWEIVAMRRYIVQKTAKHDPDFALNFLTSSRAMAEKLPEYNKSHENQMETLISSAVAKSNPKKAVQLAKEYIETTGNTASLEGTIHSLYGKDPDAARDLIDIVINKSKSNTKFDYPTLIFLANLLAAAPTPNKQQNTTEEATSLINKKQGKELTEIVIKGLQTQLSEAKTNQYNEGSFMASNVLPFLKQYVENFSPESMESFKKLQSQSDKITGVTDNDKNELDEFNEIPNNISAEKLLELAKNASSEMQYSYYDQAINKLLDEGNVEQAHKIASEQIKYPGQRDAALQTIHGHRLQKQIDGKKFDDARSTIKTMKTKAQKINAYIQLSQSAVIGNNKVLAEEFLNEAYALVSGPPKSSAQFQNQLNIATALAGLNPTRSFDIVESTIIKCNELMDASIIIGEFNQHGTIQNGELLGTENQESSYFAYYSTILPSLFHSDSARTESLLNKISRNDARTMTKLSLLQKLLGIEENTFDGNTGENRIITGRGLPLMRLAPAMVFRSN